MGESKPLVSIIITCYNVENYIRRSLESAINQSYKNLEIIIVNDKSTDSTLDIIKTYSDNRIVLLNLPENLGIGGAKKAGADYSKGKYICFLDADDYYLEDYVEVNLNKAESEGCDLSIGRKHIQFESGNEIMEMPYTISNNNPTIINAMFLRKDLYDKMGFSTLRLYEDIAMTPRIFYNVSKVGYVKDSRYVYCRRKDSSVFSANFYKNIIYKTLAKIDIIEYFNKVDKDYLKKIGLSHNFVKHSYNTRILNMRDKFEELFPEELHIIEQFINSNSE
jgi:glycosyltransferase involved in cell wall biosynthesis